MRVRVPHCKNTEPKTLPHFARQEPASGHVDLLSQHLHAAEVPFDIDFWQSGMLMTDGIAIGVAMSPPRTNAAAGASGTRVSESATSSAKNVRKTVRFQSLLKTTVSWTA